MRTVVVDSNIPFIGNSLDGIARVVSLPAEEITRENIADADALLVRTYTRCNAALLEGTNVRFVGTATIGTDHLDLEWLKANGIVAVNAPGCNAPAVAQYVAASILTLFPHPEGMTVGIVGVGHVGSLVDRWCRRLGMKTLLCDPPRAIAEGSDGFVTLDEIARDSDIVTFHTPHTRPPQPHATHHLADKAFFDALQKRPVIINAARGPVVDTQALVDALDSGRVSNAVIDCWEGEPDAISQPLLERAVIATPHIAGYSIEGKKRATRAVVEALLMYWSDELYGRSMERPQAPHPEECGRSMERPYNNDPGYDPMADTAYLRQGLKAGRTFTDLRNNYTLRHEP